MHFYRLGSKLHSPFRGGSGSIASGDLEGDDTTKGAGLVGIGNLGEANILNTGNGAGACRAFGDGKCHGLNLC